MVNAARDRFRRRYGPDCRGRDDRVAYPEGSGVVTGLGSEAEGAALEAGFGGDHPLPASSRAGRRAAWGSRGFGANG